MEFEIDSNFNIMGVDDNQEIMTFIPEVNLYELEEPNIIESF